MTAGPAIAVRRSALEVRHEALGARWIDDAVRWPAAYRVAASGDGQATTVLAELGPLDEWWLRGPGALGAAATLVPGEVAVGRVVRPVGATDLEAWVLGPDECRLVGPAGAPGLDGLAARVEGPSTSVVDMRGAHTSLRLAGPAATAIAAELCAVDLRPVSLGPDACFRAPLAGVAAMVARIDAGDTAGLTIVVARDVGLYAWDCIVAVGAPHGLAVVVPAEVRESRHEGQLGPGVAP